MNTNGTVFFCAFAAVCALAAECRGEPPRSDAPSPTARIIPDKVKVVSSSGISPVLAGDVRCETSAVEGVSLAFGPGGKIAWESSDLLRKPRGSILLDFNYSPVTDYNKDLPVLAVTGADGRDVLRLTIGRVMFKVARPPHEFATDLYLNEAEKSWLRTVITWEKLDADRMLLRTTVNDRVYDSAIVPAFPEGKLQFLIGPEKVNLREAAFYDSPLPRAPFPHKCRAPEAKAEDRIKMVRGFISRSDQKALNDRGGVVVLVPDGALTYGLLRGLRTAGLVDFRIVNDATLKAALAKAAVLILPDNDSWAPDRDRERAIADFVRAGGGLFAIGASALEALRMGLVAFKPREAGCDGYLGVQINGDASAWKAGTNSLFKGADSVELLMRRGPLYEVPPAMSNAVAAVEPFTGLSCALAAECGKGRVALSAVMPFGYYFWNPTFQTVSGSSANASRYLFFKGLLFHAAGLVPADAAPGDEWPVAERAVALADPGTTRTVSLAVESPGKKAEIRHDNLKLGRNGAIGFRFKADTLDLKGPEPRNLLWLSDGGENTFQLYYDPGDQFLVLKGMSPNGEELIYANARTTWDKKEWRHVAFTWQATETGDAAVELFIDGLPAASGGLPLPLQYWDRLIFGAAPGMPGLDMEARDLVLGADPSPDFAEVRRLAAPPHSWEDTPEDRAELDRFNSSCRVAILGDTHPNHWKTFRSYDLCGIKCDVLMQKDLAGDALEKRKYAVIVAPGGGPPPYADPQGMRDRIRNHVRSGLGYVGICAGMIEAAASASPATTLCLYEAPIKSFGGTQLVDVRLRGRSPVISGVTAAFCDGSGEPSVRFVHMSGPPVPLKGLRSAEEAVALMGMAPDCGAAISFKYGAGQGIVWAPHPELDGWGWWRPSDRTRYVMRKLLRNSIYHASGWRR